MARKPSRVTHPQTIVNPDGDYADITQRGTKYGKAVELLDGAGDLMGDSANPLIIANIDQLKDYMIVEIDESDPDYYGYEKADGGWYIMKETSNSYRYVKGTADFSDNWTGRDELDYDYPSNIF